MLIPMRDEPEEFGFGKPDSAGYFLLSVRSIKRGRGVQGEGAAFEPPCPAQHVETSRATFRNSGRSHGLPRHLSNSASLAFLICRAASVSLIRRACCCNTSGRIPSFRYCCQLDSESSFSNGVW